jgi:hypothetical protein
MAAVAAFASANATALTVASTAISAIGQAQAGAARQREYNAQAAQAEMRGRSEAIAYKQQSANVLRNLNENLAAVIARAAAGGVDATSGSAAVIQQFAMSEGIREKNTAADNALLAEGQAATQAHQYRMAGENARRASMFGAVATIGTGLYRVGQL